MASRPSVPHDPTRVLLLTFVLAAIALIAIGVVGTHILLRATPHAPPVVVVAAPPPPEPVPALTSPPPPVVVPVRSRRRVSERRPPPVHETGPSLLERTEACKNDVLCGIDIDSRR